VHPDARRNPDGGRNPEGGAALRARMWRHLLELAIFAVSLAIVWLGIVLAG
jgi:hypothetical protein